MNRDRLCAISMGYLITWAYDESYALCGGSYDSCDKMARLEDAERI